MTDGPTVVKGYADLISDAKLHGDDPDIVARELEDLTGQDDYIVAWLPDWLVEEKDIEPIGRSEHVVSGPVDHETEKAYLLVTDSGEVWLPKSVIREYRVAGDVEFTIPQTGLADYSTDGGGSA